MTPASRRLCRCAPLVLVLVLATACGDNGGSAAPSTKPATATTSSTETRPAPTGTGTGAVERGTLTTASGDLLPHLRGSLRPLAPTQVEGKSLQVVALAGPESFWAGPSASQRILVKLRLKGSSPPKIKLGQKVDFIGILTALAKGTDPGALGVKSEVDKAVLVIQGAYVNPSYADVKLR